VANGEDLKGISTCVDPPLVLGRELRFLQDALRWDGFVGREGSLQWACWQRVFQNKLYIKIIPRGNIISKCFFIPASLIFAFPVGGGRHEGYGID